MAGGTTSIVPTSSVPRARRGGFQAAVLKPRATLMTWFPDPDGAAPQYGHSSCSATPVERYECSSEHVSRRRWAPSACSSSPTQCLTSPREVICRPPASTFAPGAYSRSASAPDRSSAQEPPSVRPVSMRSCKTPSGKPKRGRNWCSASWEWRKLASGLVAAKSHAARNSSNSPRHAAVDSSKRSRSSSQNLGHCDSPF